MTANDGLIKCLDCDFIASETEFQILDKRGDYLKCPKCGAKDDRLADYDKPMTAKHTPGKWEYTGNDETIGIQRTTTLERICFIKPANYANAEFIVRACNSHDDLLAACKKSLECFRAIYNRLDIQNEEGQKSIIGEDSYWPLIQLKSAIEQAGERGE